MAKPPKIYPPEFRQKIMELIRSGESGNAVERRFNVSRQTISNWIRQADLNAGRRSDGLTSDERTELTMLRRENKRLKIEQEILSKPRSGSLGRPIRLEVRPLVHESSPSIMFGHRAQGYVNTENSSRFNTYDEALAAESFA